jgi:hypothetical protein
VVVVGESNGNLSTLAQIEDPDEIAQLLGRLQDEKSGRPSAFRGLFGHAQNKMADPHADEVAPPSARDDEMPEPTKEGASDLSGLLEKVRSIRNQMGRE